MKGIYAIKYKIKAVIGLACILLVILIGNLVIRERFSKLDQSIHSICNDRLKPSVYIFEITNIIYQKRLLLDDNLSAGEITTQIINYNQTIAGLIESYESTFLTNEEKKQWFEFKTHLSCYNDIEAQFLKSNEINKTAGLAFEAEFSSVLQDLNKLSKIQVGEGNVLEQKSKSLINSSLAFSTFEMSLLIILGLFTIAILGVTDRVIFNNTHKHHLN